MLWCGTPFTAWASCLSSWDGRTAITEGFSVCLFVFKQKECFSEFLDAGHVTFLLVLKCAEGHDVWAIKQEGKMSPSIETVAQLISWQKEHVACSVKKYPRCIGSICPLLAFLKISLNPAVAVCDRNPEESSQTVMETGCIYEANPLKRGASGTVGMTVSDRDLNLSWHLYWLLQCFSDVCLPFSHCSAPRRLDWCIFAYHYSHHLFFFHAAIEGKNKYKNKCYFLLRWGFPFFHFTTGRKRKSAGLV